MRCFIKFDSTNQIKLGAIISYISIGINILFGLIYTPWMIHSIGKENFGLYTLAMSVISFFVFDFGMSQAVQRFVAKYLAEGKPEKANNCLGLVTKLYVWLDVTLLIVLTIVYFFIPSIYQELTPTEIEKFKVVYCVAALFSVISFPFIPLNGVLNANEKFVQLKSCDLIHKFLVVGLMSACLLLGYGLYALVTVNAVAGVLTIILKLVVLKRYTDTKINYRYKDPAEFKSIMSFSGWVTAIALAQRMIFNIAPSVLGIFSGSASIAVLGIAITIEGYVYIFANVLSGFFIPKLARKIVSEENCLPLMVRVGRIQIFVVALIFFAYISIGRDFINTWVGESFSDVYVGAILLIFPLLIHSSEQIAEETLMFVNVKSKAIIYIIMAILNIVLLFVLAPLYDMLGICMAVCISYLVRTLLLNIVYNRVLQLKISVFFKESFLRMLFPLLLTLVVGIGINRVIPFSGWGGIVVKGCCFVAEYFIIMYALAMNKYEHNLIAEPVKKIYNKFRIKP